MTVRFLFAQFTKLDFREQKHLGGQALVLLVMITIATRTENIFHTFDHETIIMKCTGFGIRTLKTPSYVTPGLISHV